MIVPFCSGGESALLLYRVENSSCPVLFCRMGGGVCSTRGIPRQEQSTISAAEDAGGGMVGGRMFVTREGGGS